MAKPEKKTQPRMVSNEERRKAMRKNQPQQQQQQHKVHPSQSRNRNQKEHEVSVDASSDELWLTTLDQQHLLERQELLPRSPENGGSNNNNDNPTNPTVVPLHLVLNVSQTFQTMDGFGFALTGGSALHLSKMNPRARSALLQELFGTEDSTLSSSSSTQTVTPSIGLSYLRISIGSSDLDEFPFSYQDDPTVEFSLAPDERYLIPMLHEILSIPQSTSPPPISIMASPWSAPAWMKDNASTQGGRLLPQNYPAYAQYLVKYWQQMSSSSSLQQQHRPGHDIPIHAMTIQNEPLNEWNNPSMKMTAAEQLDFVQNHLGPAFAQAAAAAAANATNATIITTPPRLVIYDHNADRTDYPLQILAHPSAASYIDGTAFHLYAGTVESLTTVHEAHPDKNLYFTEQWIGASTANFYGDFAWHVEHVIIGTTRNWCRVVLEWNLVSNTALTPHTDGGCDQCLGAITIDRKDRTTNNDITNNNGAGNSSTTANTAADDKEEGDDDDDEYVVLSRNPTYYAVAHASKFVRPGYVRIASNIIVTDETNESAQGSMLKHVAFVSPDEKEIVVIVLNKSKEPQSLDMEILHDNACKNRRIQTSFPGEAVGTFRLSLPQSKSHPAIQTTKPTNTNSNPPKGISLGRSSIVLRLMIGIVATLVLAMTLVAWNWYQSHKRWSGFLSSQSVPQDDDDDDGDHDYGLELELQSVEEFLDE